MSEKTNARKADAVLQEAKQKLVPVRLFRGGGRYGEDVTVVVNGLTYKIQRGVEVMVPEMVREVLERSQEQDARAEQLMEESSRRFVRDMQEL